MTIALSSNAAQILGVLINNLTSASKGADALARRLHAAKAAAVGLGSAAVSFGFGKFLWDAAKASESLRDEQIKLGQQLGYNADVVKKMSDTAYFMTQVVPGTKWAENLATEREIGAIVQDPDVTMKIAPNVAKAVRVLQLETGKDTGGVTEMFRFLEMRGAVQAEGADGSRGIDVKKLNSEITGMFKAVQASGGMLKLSSFLALIQQGGPAVKNMDPEQLYGQYAAVMMAMGPYRAGTALMSFMSQQLGGPIQARALRAEEKLGLIDKSKVHEVGKGSTKSYLMDKGALIGFDPAKPIDYMLNVLRPKLMKMSKDDGEAVIRAIFQISSKQTSARMLSDVITNPLMFANELKRYREGQSPQEGLEAFNAKSLTANLGNLTAAWANFMAVLGDSGAMDHVIAVIQGITSGLNVLGNTMKENPNLGKMLTDFAAGIAIVAGALAIAAFTMAGLRAIGLLRAAGAGAAAAAGAGAAGAGAAGAAAVASKGGWWRALMGGGGLLGKGVFGFLAKLNMWGTVAQLSGDTPATAAGDKSNPIKSFLGQGGTLERWLKSFHLPDMDLNHHLKTAYPDMSAGPPKPEQHSETIQNNIYLDGRKIAEVVSGYLARSRPLQGTSGPDIRNSAMMPGMVT